jgi:hypothetical protein
LANIKHIGRLKNNKRKVVVAYRTLPNDPHSALVIFTDALPSDEHGALMGLVESTAGQDAYELAEIMARVRLPDGRVMLSGFHSTGRLFKIPTADVEMTPNTSMSIGLDELNRIIAQQKGVDIADLALSDGNAPAKRSEPQTTVDPVEAYTATPAAEAPLSDEDLARRMRGQADALYKEAKRLRDDAERLHPIKKPAAKVKESSDHQ